MTNGPSPARSPRTSVMLRALVFRQGHGDASEHRVINLSTTGVGIAQPGDLGVGEMVVVSIGQVEHARGEVIWVRGGQAGLHFYEPIDLARARLRRLDTGAAPPPAAGWLTDIDDAYRR